MSRMARGPACIREVASLRRDLGLAISLAPFGAAAMEQVDRIAGGRRGDYRRPGGRLRLDGRASGCGRRRRASFGHRRQRKLGILVFVIGAAGGLGRGNAGICYSQAPGRRLPRSVSSLAPGGRLLVPDGQRSGGKPSSVVSRCDDCRDRHSSAGRRLFVVDCGLRADPPAARLAAARRYASEQACRGMSVGRALPPTAWPCRAQSGMDVCRRSDRGPSCFAPAARCAAT